MKFLSCGWQYIVYDIGNERVKKVKHSKWTQYAFIFIQILPHRFKKHIHLFKEVKKEALRVNELQKSSNEYIKSIFNLLDKEILGNLVFINDTDYEQDKVLMIEKIYKNKNDNELKNILENYIKLIHKTWGYGFADTVYRWTANNGINKNKEVIQADFGEIITQKDRVVYDIQNKRWERFAKYLRKDIKDYYLKRMNEEMTEEKLNELWGKRLVNGY